MWRDSRIERDSSGFTLVELLVALAIFVIAGMIAYRGLNAVAATKGSLDREIRFWRELGLIFERMETDFEQSVAQPLSVGEGGLAPAFQGKSGEGRFFIKLVRMNGDRSPLHVHYRCDKGELTLALGTVDRQDLRRTVLLGSVDRCEVSFLDASNAWRFEWPGVQGYPRPRAIRIRLVLSGHGPFERIYPLP